MWLLSFAVTIACCCNEARYQFEMQRFRGTWEVVAASVDGEPVPFSKVGTKFRVADGTFRVLDPGERLAGTGLDEFQWVIDRWQPSRILVFWFEGIYKFNDNDELQFCVKYNGQGVEGEYAKQWRPPTDFVARKGQEHLFVVLKRR